MGTIYEEWRNRNENINYPFADTASLARGTPVALDKRLLLDARLYAIGGGTRQYLSEITTEDSKVVMVVSDETGELARGSFEPESDDLTDIIDLSDGFGRPAGVLVGDISRMRALGGWTGGARVYTIDDTEFAGTVVVPTPQIGVRGFVVPSGEFFAGDFWLVGENGVYFTREDGTIRVDLVGDPEAQKKFCEDLNVYRQPFFVKTINTIGPNENGEFRLLSGSNIASDTALRLEPTTNGIILKLAGKSLHAPN